MKAPEPSGPNSRASSAAAQGWRQRMGRRRIFDNGVTRARAAAWLGCLAWAIGCAGFARANRPVAGLRWAALATAFGLGAHLLLMRQRPIKIPVLNYHSVSENPAWLQIGRLVSIHPDAFERQLAWLKRNGYRTLFISELHDLLTRQKPMDAAARYVALTFDDGYLDNWVAAFPLLKKYGMKATLFVSADFVEAGERCRPTQKQGGEAASGLTWEGYLNWGELRAMRASGLVEVQSHGARHAREFTNPDLRGFVAPGRPNLWLYWNCHPEKRLAWWRELNRDTSLWGHPIFPQAPGLAAVAYRPDPASVASMLSWTRGQGAAFFEQPGWERRLRAEWDRLPRMQGRGGTWESDAEYARRVESELGNARQTLEERLGAPVRFLCWPENAFTEVGEAMARATGHVATLSNRHDSTNTPGHRPDRIVRVFIGSHAAGFAHPWLDFIGFVFEVRVFEGAYAWYPLLAAMHLAKKMVFGARKRSSCHRDFLSAWD